MLLRGVGVSARRLLELSPGFTPGRYSCAFAKRICIGRLKCRQGALTLKRLDIMCNFIDTFVFGLSRICNLPLLVDDAGLPPLSKAIKIRDVTLHSGSASVDWVVAALQTATPKHRGLQQITIRIAYEATMPFLGSNVRENMEDHAYEQWLDLDRLLIQLLELFLIRPKVECVAVKVTQEMRDALEWLLPEMAKRGGICLTGPGAV